MSNKKIFTGIDLLNKVLEFTEMTPSKSDWKVSVLNSNPPRLMRFLQIKSLSTAFIALEKNKELNDEARFYLVKRNPTIQSFLNGDFIRLRELSEYDKAIKIIKEYVKKNSRRKFDYKEDFRMSELVSVFERLVSYKRHLRKISTFNSGWYESNAISSQFSIILTDSISKNIADKQNDLDNILELLINTEGRSFTEDELISKFKYPKGNLFDIDMDY